MLKFIASLIDRLNESADIDEAETDPLLHPSMRCMSQRELADLPFGSMRKKNAGPNDCPA